MMVTMMVSAKVKPEKIEEFRQTMGSLEREKESRECYYMDFMVCREVHDSSVFNLFFEWEKEQDFEFYLDGNEFKVVCGAIKVLCEKSSFSCNSLSEKWSRFAGRLVEPHHAGAVAVGNFIFQGTG